MKKLNRFEIPADADTSPKVIDHLNQKFCSNCGGLKQMTYKEKVVDPFDWHRFGCASDIGCIC